MEVINDLRLADSSHFCGHPDISANAFVLGFVIYGVRGPAPPWCFCAASLVCTTVSSGSLVVRIKHVLKSSKRQQQELAYKFSCSVISDSATPWTQTVHGVLQAGILEWVAFPFSRGSSQPGIKPRSPALQTDSLPAEPQGKTKNTGVGTLSPYPAHLPDPGIEPGGLLHCRGVLYQLSYQGSHNKKGEYCFFLMIICYFASLYVSQNFYYSAILYNITLK